MAFPCVGDDDANRRMGSPGSDAVSSPCVSENTVSKEDNVPVPRTVCENGTTNGDNKLSASESVSDPLPLNLGCVPANTDRVSEGTQTSEDIGAEAVDENESEGGGEQKPHVPAGKDTDACSPEEPDPNGCNTSQVNRRLSCKEIDDCLQQLDRTTKLVLELPSNDGPMIDCHLFKELSREDAEKTIDEAVDKVIAWAEEQRGRLKDHANSHSFTDKRDKPGRRQTHKATTNMPNDSGIFSEDITKDFQGHYIQSLKVPYEYSETEQEQSSNCSNECNVCFSQGRGCTCEADEDWR